MSDSTPPPPPEERKAQRAEALRQIEQQQAARRAALNPEEREKEDRANRTKGVLVFGTIAVLLMSPVFLWLWRQQAPAAPSLAPVSAIHSTLLNADIPTATSANSQAITEAAQEVARTSTSPCTTKQESFSLGSDIDAMNAVWQAADSQGYKRNVLNSGSLGGVTQLSGPKNILVIEVPRGLFLCEN